MTTIFDSRPSLRSGISEKSATLVTTGTDMTAHPTQRGPSPRRFTVSEYRHMGKSGILRQEDRLELIDGEIIEMAPIGSRHAGHLNHLVGLVSKQLADEPVLSVQNPLELGDHSEPQPDLAVLNPRDDAYASSHPIAGDVLLLVEIADTSLEFDRTTKIPLYARHGVPVVWLLNLPDKTVEVYERPDTDGYRVVHSLREDATVEHPDLDLRFEADDLFVE